MAIFTGSRQAVAQQTLSWTTFLGKAGYKREKRGTYRKQEKMITSIKINYLQYNSFVSRGQLGPTSEGCIGSKPSSTQPAASGLPCDPICTVTSIEAAIEYS
jgi:hypothetical protein